MLKKKLYQLIMIICLLLHSWSSVAAYTCGDVDNSGGTPDVADLVYFVDYMFRSGPTPAELGACNVDGDWAAIDISDMVYMVAYMFTSGPPLNCPSGLNLTYPIVDTDQLTFYDITQVITEPLEDDPYYGQDATYSGNQPSYTISIDGLTVLDNITGLTWTKSADINGDDIIDVYDKLYYDEALLYPDTLNTQNFGGYSDWRLPSMKELYSLMNFNGRDPSGPNPTNLIPFIDTDYFDFGYGDESSGERLIDAQFWSTNMYSGTVFNGQQATFGLNLADGRIKGYPSDNIMGIDCYVYFVRGNTSYGINNFADNGDGTISDSATGLMWTQNDSDSAMTWGEALQYAVDMNSQNYLGYSDWRVPNAKELHSLFDYSRGPDATFSPAIDPIFSVTEIINESGAVDYPWYWSSTTHVKDNGDGSSAVYLCFGRSTGYMMGTWLDVHGAGAQRSDRKYENYSGYSYVPFGWYHTISPQGDAVRMFNYVRLVRDIK